MQKNINPFLEFWSKFPSVREYRNPFFDPDTFSKSMSHLGYHIMQNPSKQKHLQETLQQETQALTTYILAKIQGKEAEAPVQTPKRDKRFSHEQWDSNIFFDIIKQSYLVYAKWLEEHLHDTLVDIDPELKDQVRFYIQQIVHAYAPTNFALLNPSVMEEAVNTGGASLMKGFLTMAEDMAKGKDPDMTDMDHFKIGENLATTPGRVVFRNDLFELIQYTPTTKDVYQQPLLIVPPWINKFYVFDLSEEKSMVRWLLDQGRTVFIVSWANPTTEHRHKSMESYVLEGAKVAVETVKAITKQESIDALGYCLGGTLLTCLAAYFENTGRNDLASLTLLTTLTDFSNAGDLSAFISEDYVLRIEKMMQKKGYLSGRVMARTFNMLRPSELIWSYVVNNYYLGKSPVPLDFLYWNSDNTNMPEKMHKNLLRLFYRKNVLSRAGEFKVGGTPVDLSKIKLPVYMMSTKDDHIAPWKSTYMGTQLMKNAKLTFVLGGSGHVAGVINPPHKNKYGYWTSEDLKPTADLWKKNTQQHEGSWWTHWNQWLVGLNRKKTKALTKESKAYPTITEAPGLYVLQSCD